MAKMLTHWVKDNKLTQMNNQVFKLIDGDFLPQDAKEVLVKLFLNKIQFHEMKNFSTNERSGEDDLVAIKRIPELKESLAKIKDILESENAIGKRVTIKTYVEISLND